MLHPDEIAVVLLTSTLFSYSDYVLLLVLLPLVCNAIHPFLFEVLLTLMVFVWVVCFNGLIIFLMVVLQMQALKEKYLNDLKDLCNLLAQRSQQVQLLTILKTSDECHGWNMLKCFTCLVKFLPLWDIGHSLLEIFYGLMTSLAFNLAMQKVIRDIETWKFWSCLAYSSWNLWTWSWNLKLVLVFVFHVFICLRC